MKHFSILFGLFLLFSNLYAQETKVIKKPAPSSTNIGVVDMKKILAQSKAYQSLVDQFEDVITPDVLSRVDQVYRDFVKWTECDTLLLNVDDEDLSREILEVREFLRC